MVSVILTCGGYLVLSLSIRNTDYILIPREKVDAAIAALTEDGWKFRPKSKELVEDA